MSIKLFRDKTVGDHAGTLAAFMPGGRPFLAKNIEASTLYKMLYGLAVEAYRVENVMSEIASEHDIRETTLLIEQWESALGIPDHCFDTSGTIEERRRNVLIKLGSSIQTEQDFVDLAALFNMTVDIVAGADIGIFPMPFPFTLFDSPATARFTMIVNVFTLDFPNVFPLDFPILFVNNRFAVVECLFESLKPANVDVVFYYQLPDLGALITESGRLYIESELSEYIIKE